MLVQERTKHLKLPFQFSEEKLLQDLSLVLDDNWISHFNPQDYSGDWKVIALYAPGGDASNIYALPSNQSALLPTPILKACHYFQEVIDAFKCPILTARILRLGAGAEIKPHSDYNLGYEDGCFRLHIPITTNPEVRFMLDGQQLTMLPGECWYTNVNYEHAVVNGGTSDRVHLVIDGERNDWSDELFFSLAPEESFRPAPDPNDSPVIIRQTIEALKHSDEPIAQQLISELVEKLAKLEREGGV